MGNYLKKQLKELKVLAPGEQAWSGGTVELWAAINCRPFKKLTPKLAKTIQRFFQIVLDNHGTIIQNQAIVTDRTLLTIYR